MVCGNSKTKKVGRLPEFTMWNTFLGEQKVKKKKKQNLF